MKRAQTAVVAVAMLAAGSGSCSASAEHPVDSPCVAFAKASAPSLRTEPLTTSTRASALVRVRAGAGRTYALDVEGKLGTLDGDAAAAILVGGLGGVDFTVTKSTSGVVQAFVARWTAEAAGAPTTFELVRFTSADGGLTFDAASKKVLLSALGGRPAGEAASLAFGVGGLLFVALGDADPAPGGGAAPTLLGSILRLDVSGDAFVVPPDNPFAPAGGVLAPVWAAGVHEPRGLDVDPETGDLWLTDFSKAKDTTYVHRIVRGGITALVPALSLGAADRRAAFAGGHVYRGKLMPALVGRYVYPAFNGTLVAIDRHGPSGPPQEAKLAVGAEGPIFRADGDELGLAAGGGGVARVVDGSVPVPTPTSLVATKCWDLAAPAGVPAGAIAYDVTSPLWSDGATKERFVVVPRGAKITARPDGDLVFPVGTVAVKTFAVDGKRVETRLLVQHDREDWTGYSYAWNEAGTDAELVAGNRVAQLAGGKSWYFPSTADCTACHTPAAGYTLGLEAKQLAGRGDALARLEARLETPIDRAALGTLVAADARSYLHVNCSMCHREGSATGSVVELDLRVDTPLAKTGLCKEPQAGTFDLPDARIVAPGDPSRSVLLSRMRTLDERRMPKLATRVVDETGVAAVEAWIKSLAACP